MIGTGDGSVELAGVYHHPQTSYTNLPFTVLKGFFCAYQIVKLS
jgi:hypothetical protein